MRTTYSFLACPIYMSRLFYTIWKSGLFEMKPFTHIAVSCLLPLTLTGIFDIIFGKFKMIYIPNSRNL